MRRVENTEPRNQRQENGVKGLDGGEQRRRKKSVRKDNGTAAPAQKLGDAAGLSRQERRFADIHGAAPLRGVVTSAPLPPVIINDHRPPIGFGLTIETVVLSLQVTFL